MPPNNEGYHPSHYNALKKEIGDLLKTGRQQAARQVNTILVHTYWQIGRYIVEFEQKGQDRAAYGEHLLESLAKDLCAEYGKGFSRSNLSYMRQLFLVFPKRETLSHKLTWSHYFEILKSDDSLERSFYLKQCEKENWSVRELKRQKKSMLFHRIALSKSKEDVLKLATKGVQIQESKDILRYPYVFEFLDLPQQEKYLEGDL